MSSSSALAPIWSALLRAVPERMLKTWGLFVLHELSYWLSSLPFHVFDIVPFFRRYKLQPDKPLTASQYRRCALRVVANHVLLVLPIILATHPLFDMMGCATAVSALPSLPVLAAHLAACFLIEDFVFYWGHRLLHTPALYNWVHAIHHHHAAPFGIAAEYAHPAEVLFLGFATLAGPLIIAPHLATLYIYLALRCFQTVECHSGYDLPFSPRRWIPGYGGAEFHDHHHRIHSGNYASTFVWADWAYGTDVAYRAWRKANAKQQRLEDAGRTKLAS